MGGMVASEYLHRPIHDTLDNGLAILRRAQRRVHLEVGVISGPGWPGCFAIGMAKNALAIAAPEFFAARDSCVGQHEMVRTRFTRHGQAPLPGLADQPHAPCRAEVLA